MYEIDSTKSIIIIHTHTVTAFDAIDVLAPQCYKHHRTNIIVIILQAIHHIESTDVEINT